MVEILAQHQLNLMLTISGICGTIAGFAFITKALSVKRRIILILHEFATLLLVSFDRLAYIYHGNTTARGFYMVRISNFLVYSMTLVVILSFNMYLKDIMLHEVGIKEVPLRLKAVSVLIILGIVMIILSQFTGWYYTFSENNEYSRGSLFVLCYLFPVVTPMVQLSVIVQYRKKVNRGIYISLLTFVILPIAASVVQFFAYGLSLTNMTIAVASINLYVVALFDINESVEKANLNQMEYLKESQERMRRLFDQTARAFVNAVDAVDTNSIGHSSRVAEYSKRIAELSNMSEEDCNDVYYSALLHDVGNIGIPENIIKKEGGLTKEEEEKMRRQPEIGNRILSAIKDYPSLAVGAHYHKERYDGKGYPDGLKGEQIPTIARIIAVAEEYDSMTSKSGSREPLPQQIVREEFVRGAGIKYDPQYAVAMLHMIDADKDYSMRVSDEDVDAVLQNEFECDEYRKAISLGIPIDAYITEISFESESTVKKQGDFSAPSIILFDSYDGRVHDTEGTIRATRYVEYGEMWFDGHTISTSARNMQTNFLDYPEDKKYDGRYVVETVKNRDHVRLRMYGGEKVAEVIVALQDNSRNAYVALTGEHCHISKIRIEKKELLSPEDAIPRIANEISYLNRLESDLPNIQINNAREEATVGIEIRDGMSIAFHAMSLPSATLVWHCPSILLFSSDDKKVKGDNYHEYALIRLHGEKEDNGIFAINDLSIEKSDEFKDWDQWLKKCKKGMECFVSFNIKGNKVTTFTKNEGITIRNETLIKDGSKTVFAALTGDQCALTDIRVI